MTAPAKASQGTAQAAQAVPELTDAVDGGEESQPAPAKPARKRRQQPATPTNNAGGSPRTSNAGRRPQKRSQSGRGGASSSSRATPTPSIVSGDAGESVAGVLLAAFFWGWVALPFLTGGVDGVKNMLRAKFLNKAPDGTYLP